jgi:hypothetical protein
MRRQNFRSRGEIFASDTIDLRIGLQVGEEQCE